MDEAKAAMDTDDKNVREERWNKLIDHWHELFLDDYPDMDKYLEELHLQVPEEDRQGMAAGGSPCGRPRQSNEIRPLAAEVGVLPRVHGSGLFTRGQTQVLSVCHPEHPVRLPEAGHHLGRGLPSAICTTTTSPPTPPARPGAAAPPTAASTATALWPSVRWSPCSPPWRSSPMPSAWCPRCSSSNGSTSQGSICGSTLALMDAGVPIKAPVAGISCGLIQDDDGSFNTFIDIQGVEDFHGEMDFKVAGTKAGITAIQMDLKNDGLTHGDHQERAGHHPRRPLRDPGPDHAALHPRAPRRGQPQRPQDDQDEDRHRQDPRGHRLRRQGHPEDSAPTPAPRSTSRTTATIFISGPDAESVRRRQEDPSRPSCSSPRSAQLYYGKVVRIIQFGAFVELAPGKDGHGAHLQAGQPPGGEGGGRGQHRRYDLGQGHRHRREGPRQPEPTRTPCARSASSRLRSNFP